MASLLFAKSICIFSLVLSVMFSPTSAGSKGSKVESSTLSLNQLITEVYQNNYDFIVNGVPALLVEDMVSRAIFNVVQSCSLSDTEIDRSCSNLFLTTGFIVKQIQTEIELDSSRDLDQEFFPLYQHHQKRISLAGWQQAILDDFRDYSLQQSASVGQIASSEWSGISYPDEGVLYEDTPSAIDSACDALLCFDGNIEKRVSAQVGTAYMIGLVLKVRFAGGDIAAAHDLLAQHVHFVFNSLRCTGEAWSELKIPIVFVADNALVAKQLLEDVAISTTNRTLAEKVRQMISEVPNIVKIANLAWNHHSGMVDYLSSWASVGRSDFFVQSKNDKLIVITIEEDLAALSEAVYNGDGPQYRYSCPTGWYSVFRAGYDPGTPSTCCAEPCQSMAVHYTSMFMLEFDQDDCCALCNQGSCPGAGMAQVISLYVDNIEDRLACVISL